MKIAVIGSKGLPPHEGGIEHHCAEIYPRVATEGHLVDLFARSSSTGLSWRDPSEFRGVRIVSLPGSRFKGFDALLNSAISTVVACVKRYDIVHFHALGPSLWVWLPHLFTRSKIIVTCHGLDWQRSKWGKFSSLLIRLGEWAVVRFADRIIVVSKDLQRYFWQTYGRETIYIGNAPASYAVSESSFSYGTSLGLDKGRYIVFLGRLVPEKCPDLLISAFGQLQLEGWKLVIAGGIVGNSAFTKDLIGLAAGRPDIVFTGELQGAHLAEIVRNAGIFILPSAVEGLSLALLEAMHERVPAIASDLPVHQMLLGQDRGLLFRTNDLASCMSTIEWAVQHPRQLEVMASKAQAYVDRHHNWDENVVESLTIYQQVLASGNLPTAVRAAVTGGMKPAADVNSAVPK
jgi:glycosyltransferase involved in cell wall biosynthesis